MPKLQLILGSQSRGRQKVFKQTGFDFITTSADIDEKAIRHDDIQQLPLLIAAAKTAALMPIVDQHSILITADTVVTYAGELREKPRSPTEARDFLRSYNPTIPALVHTGVVVTNLQTSKQATGITQAAVYFKTIPAAIIEQAITDGYVMGCAGAFAVELPLLHKFVDHIEGGEDMVIGMPLELTQTLLQEVV